MAAIDIGLWRQIVLTDVRLTDASRRVARLIGERAVDGVLVMSMAEVANQTQLLNVQQPVAALRNLGFISTGHTGGRRATVLEITKPAFIVAAIEPEAVTVAAAASRYRSARKNFTPAESSW
jgi:hypothetical protein